MDHVLMMLGRGAYSLARVVVMVLDNERPISGSERPISQRAVALLVMNKLLLFETQKTGFSSGRFF